MVAITITVAALVAWQLPYLVKRWIPLLALALLIPATAWAGAALVKDLGSTATASRPGEPTCVDYGLTICTWPEHETAVAQAEPQIRRIAQIANSTDITLPERLVENSAQDLVWPDVSFGTNATSPPQVVADSVISSLLPEPDSECYTRLNGGDRADSGPSYQAARSASEAWWQRKLDSARPINPHPLDAASVEEFLALSDDAAADALDQAREAISTCAPLEQFPPR